MVINKYSKEIIEIDELKEKLKVGHIYLIDNSDLIRVIEHRDTLMGSYIMITALFGKPTSITSLSRDKTIEDVKYPYSKDIINAIEAMIEWRMANIMDRVMHVKLESGKSGKEIRGNLKK